MKWRKLLCFLLCIPLVLSLYACGNKSGTVSQEETEKEETAFLTLDGGNITAEKLFGIDGTFVEKGRLDEVENTTALLIKNNSDKMLEYLTLSFRVNTYERADFSVSALPPGEKVLVMESLARPYSADDEFELDKETTAFAYCESSTESPEAEVKTDGSNITVKNKTENPVNVTIVYKYYKQGEYYGGIAFRGKFENITPGGSVTKKSDHFTDGCKIVNVITEYVENNS